MDTVSYLLGKKAGGGSAGALKYVIVDELPTTGEDNTIYLVPKTTSGESNYYDEYMYINNSWEKIGDTEVDLSGKQDVMQFSSMPSPSANNLGKIVQYIGTTDVTYTNGYFYIVASNGSGGYVWQNIDVQENIPSYAKVLEYSTTDYAYVLTDLNPGIYYFPSYDFIGPSNWEKNATFKIGTSTIQNVKIPVGGYIHIIQKPSEATIGSSEYNYSSICIVFNTITSENPGPVISKIRRTGQNTYTMDKKYPLTFVGISGDQTIMGAKSFYTLPKSSYASMPTTDDQFVIKKYVDNKPTTYSGYDATKTQVLKNINGTLTWVDE